MKKKFDITKEIFYLTRSKKLELLKELLSDLGESYITINNLSGILEVSESTTKRCFRVFDKRRKTLVLPSFVRYKESFEHIWKCKNLLENSGEILDLLTEINRIIKYRASLDNQEYSKMKSRYYCAKSQILWQLREKVVEVYLEKREDDESCYAILLDTGHKFHLPIKVAVNPSYWNERVLGEREYFHPESRVIGDYDTNFYKAAIDLLFYLQKRGLYFMFNENENQENHEE